MLSARIYFRLSPSKGFTLIELVVGIVMLSVALLVITKALGPLFQRTADPWHQVRAAELGHSFLNEIMARSFDEMSDKAGGEFRCSHDGVSYEQGAVNCTVGNPPEPVACIDRTLSTPDCGVSSCWGPENDEDRTQTSTFDDVDDFHGLVLTGKDLVKNIVNESLAADYNSYTICVDVRYAGSELGSAQESAKKVTVSVVTPLNEQINFAAYRSNW
ncbi:type IV pilus modification PilV family protein [Rheinheimera mangrovi]|uniref:type IV pilus modification PilV family protein n=1 Tax=Rheinheimera mangrovi TaxID=2498451 RepID=UPI000F8E5A5A|nr:prepilin-type N-terminal cleavage/methylation domain-containing protein [Rheinheimera mangrovi]